MQDLHRLVPSEYVENLRFRIEVLNRCERDAAFAEDVWIACSRDLLFWVNTFVVTVDPRKLAKGKSVVAPFITYGYQERTMKELVDAIENQHDYAILKSRDMGASWMCLLVFLWFWLFRPMVIFKLGSRTEEYVDDPENPDCLFWKLDYALTHLPAWMTPEFRRTYKRLKNLDMGGVMGGESTNKNFSAGGRATAMLLDELARVELGYEILSSTRDVTGCRIGNSTPQGVGNAHYDFYTRSEHKARLHWSEHPEKAAGLYYSTNGKLQIMDQSYSFPVDYPFIKDGKMRSPWYDRECRRSNSPQEIAQELDCDFLGSAFQAFKQEDIVAHKAKYASEPLHVGEFVFDKETLEPIEFIENPKGLWRIWIPLDHNGRTVPADDYAVAADIAMGTGASNSTLSVGSKTTGEKVAEFADPNIDPNDHADLAIAICKWFKDADRTTAFLIWENNGPGAAFRKRVLKHGYTRIYFRMNERNKFQRFTDDPGWYPTIETKSVLLTEYRSALRAGRFVNRSEVSLEECLQYIIEPTGEWVHSKAKKNQDPTGAKASHGDRVIADALLCRAIQFAAARVQEVEDVIPDYSYQWRNKRFAERDGDKDVLMSSSSMW